MNISQIASAQRLTNARRVTATLGSLNVLAIPIVVLFDAAPAIVLLLTATALGQGLAYALVRAERAVAGVLLSMGSLVIEHVGAVAISGSLGPVPFIGALPILLGAATLRSRFLPSALGLVVLALAVEGWLSPWSLDDRVAIVTAGLFTVAVFVVSMLHVRGTERAFDIAEREGRARDEAAALARESEQRYRVIADHTDDLIALHGRDGQVIYLSPSHERLFGRPLQELMQSRPDEFLPPDCVVALRRAFAEARERGSAHFEVSVRAGDGSPRTIDARLNRVNDDGGTVIIGRDITERHKLERRLLTAERLEALGRLAGGVAHDFNNLLTVIRSGAELARDATRASRDAGDHLELVLQATDTASKLTRQLLMFSRKQLLVRTRLEPAAALEAQRGILERLVGKDVTVEFAFAPDLPRIEMPVVHLEQLAMNLVLNGRDAMPNGGRLVVGLSRRSLGPGEVVGCAAGEYVELSVSDEGVGIPDHVLEHVFDPFFTTKGESGTGLGLATCLSIASQLGGGMAVTSRVGRGTTFRVYLPASGEAPISAPESRKTSWGRRVLLVDIEPSVREVATRLLESEGYDVRTASSQDEARRIIADPGVALDAVLIDVVLSGDRGTDFLDECRNSRPAVRIVLMSGYTPDPGVARSSGASGARLLAKPFGRDALLAALGEPRARGAAQ